MSNDPRPNFTVARCCKNCHYYKILNENAIRGHCLLAEPKQITLAMCTCDAHIWVKSRTVLQVPAFEVGAQLPDDAI